MVELNALVAYTDSILDVSAFQDYCPNGLQVAGQPRVAMLVTGVTASLALIDAALSRGADAVLVHHGYFWKGEHPCITGMKRQRLKRLLENDTSLLAYHLPLDAHPEYGNNAQLAQRLGFVTKGAFGAEHGPALAFYGITQQPITGTDLAVHIQRQLGREPLYVPGGEGPVHTVGWCSGAAQHYIEQAAERGLDAFLSGEISEQTVHVAREMGIHYYAAGHHATERYGVEALGRHLASRFGLEHDFIDIDNPV